MLSKDVVLSVQNISKKYVTVKGGLFNKEEDIFWAVKDISFEVKKGQILGIIGLNGAGKSTILKILSEVIPPTSGQIEYKGSILSILDIGTGFHPDLSGYENIFLNSSLLGMKEKKTLKNVDEIIAFSGIGDYIHEPVKNYSNGMYLRLALSIALFTDNEIILLDEVISVGDVEFRYKAIEKIKEQANDGKACIMISHDLGSVIDLCDECILMEKGQIIYKGNSKLVVEDYYNKFYNHINNSKVVVLDHQMCKIISVKMEKETIYMDEPAIIIIQYEVKEEGDFKFFLKLRNYHSSVLTASDAFRSDYKQSSSAPGIYETRCLIPANLFNAGAYLVDVIMGTETALFIEYQLACRFKVILKEWEINKIWNSTNEIFPFRPICNWETIPIVL